MSQPSTDGPPYPQGSAPYPVQDAFPQLQNHPQEAGAPMGTAPYPTSDALPQLQQPEMTSAQAPSKPRAPPRPTTGPGQGRTPYPQQGSNMQGQNQPPYPGQSSPHHNPQGHTPYPAQGQSPYPGQAQNQGSYPGQSQNPYSGQSSAPYPSHGQAQNIHPNQQSHGQAPYPGQGQSPYPGQGQVPHSGQAPYPGQGPHSGQGQAPYPGQGQVPHSGQAPYPGQGPHSGQGQAPYPGQGPVPHSGQAPYPGQGPHSGQGQAPYPGQGQVPHSGQAPYPGQGPHSGQGQAPHPGQGQAPYTQGQVPYPGQGQAPYPGHRQQASHSPVHHPHTQVPFQGSGQPHQLSTRGASPQRHAAPTASQGDRVIRAGTDDFKSRVEIRIECKNLLNKDVLSKSDPCAALYMMRAGRWEEVGRTENVKNCLDPRFSKSFVVNYFFEEVQKVMIAVYDLDNATPQLTDDDFLGQIETTLGQLVSNTPMTAPLVLKNKKKAGQGTIIIRTEELKEGSENVMLTFRAQKLDKKDFLGKSDPYLEIQRATPEGTWQIIHRTEVIKNNLNPSWRPFQLSIQSMCGGNRQQSIKIDCYDWDSDGSHDYIGSFTTTLEEMLTANQQEVAWSCVNQSKKAKKKNYTNSGTIFLTSCKIFKDYTFLDYITGGMQINFTIGIDFTASNGNPSSSSSLHYINPYEPNEYMAAIKAVGEVCQDYDTDKLFPALGFGAKIPPAMQVSHEFAVNFNAQNPFCKGIDGVLQAYCNCIQQVQLYGPTNAAPIINHVANFAASAQKEELNKGAHAYYILLMLTDGVLSDMSNTKTAIVQASKLPMSLIIVGVGQADFDDMEVLDADNGVLKASNGEPAKRDIVQFVPFREFKNSSSVELARHVLAEVPKQVTEYFKQRAMQPIKKPSL